MGPGAKQCQEPMSHCPSLMCLSFRTHLQGHTEVGQLLLQVNLNDEVPSL